MTILYVALDDFKKDLKQTEVQLSLYWSWKGRSFEL